MSMFEGAVLDQTVGVAKAHGIDPPALLAVVEIESAGKSMEGDGKTPCLLFERHVFYRELKKAGKKYEEAKAAGLANETWQPKTQYKDQGTSAGRLALFAKATAFDAECAARSCSWGVGQTMGFNAPLIGFATAVAMLNYMKQGGVPAQVDCLVREIERTKLTSTLNAHSWAKFARAYNGSGYAENHYDTKLAAAYDKWSKTILPKGAIAPAYSNVPITPPPAVTKTAVAAVATSVAATGGAWAYFKNNPTVLILLGLIVVLAVATVITKLRSHSKQDIELGTLGAAVEASGGS